MLALGLIAWLICAAAVEGARLLSSPETGRLLQSGTPQVCGNPRVVHLGSAFSRAGGKQQRRYLSSSFKRFRPLRRLRTRLQRRKLRKAHAAIANSTWPACRQRASAPTTQSPPSFRARAAVPASRSSARARQAFTPSIVPHTARTYANADSGLACRLVGTPAQHLWSCWWRMCVRAASPTRCPCARVRTPRLRSPARVTSASRTGRYTCPSLALKCMAEVRHICLLFVLGNGSFSAAGEL